MKSDRLLVILALVTLIVVVMMLRPKQPPSTTVVRVQETVPTPRPFLGGGVLRSPEFRKPPLKEYKPRMYQQMGLLLSDDETLPLYGKESPTHRDRYFYYTTTPGDQIYPLPVSYDNRDCMDDIGCQEFYGNEEVTVTGKSGSYKTKIYSNRQMYYDDRIV